MRIFSAHELAIFGFQAVYRMGQAGGLKGSAVDAAAPVHLTPPGSVAKL